MAKTIKWVEVESSNVGAIGYDPKTQTLFVRFHSSFEESYYSYENVEQVVFDQFVAAESAGKFFNQNVKPAFICQKHSLAG